MSAERHSPFASPAGAGAAQQLPEPVSAAAHPALVVQMEAKLGRRMTSAELQVLAAPRRVPLLTDRAEMPVAAQQLLDEYCRQLDRLAYNTPVASQVAPDWQPGKAARPLWLPVLVPQLLCAVVSGFCITEIFRGLLLPVRKLDFIIAAAQLGLILAPVVATLHFARRQARLPARLEQSGLLEQLVAGDRQAEELYDWTPLLLRWLLPRSRRADLASRGQYLANYLEWFMTQPRLNLPWYWLEGLLIALAGCAMYAGAATGHMAQLLGVPEGVATLCLAGGLTWAAAQQRKVVYLGSLIAQLRNRFGVQAERPAAGREGAGG